MNARRRNVDEGFEHLLRAKLPLVSSSDAAARDVRSCADCDARCCKAGLNSMRVSRIEALALARRLREADLAPRIPEVLARARAEVERRGLDPDEDRTYDCPLLGDDGACLVHGPAQPAGCLTFKPLDGKRCDHDLPLFNRQNRKIQTVEKRTLRKRYPPLPIPIALLKVLRTES